MYTPSLMREKKLTSWVLIQVLHMTQVTAQAVCTQGAFMHPIRLLVVFWLMWEFTFLGQFIVLEIWLNRLVLLVEEHGVGNMVFGHAQRSTHHPLD